MAETPAVHVSDGTMRCPVPSPDGLPCAKRIPKGWTGDEGHGGGHFWISPETEQALERGHYDATAALAGQPFTIHQPEDCTPACPRYGKRCPPRAGHPGQLTLMSRAADRSPVANQKIE